MKTILAALDLSPGSGRVCAAACALARPLDSHLVLLHVIVPPAVPLTGVGFAVSQVRSMMAALEKRAARRLEALGRRCEAQLGRHVSVALREGDPAALILGKAGTIRAGCIVLGSHGHTAAYDLLIGSTTQAVLRRSKCPVHVVPMRPAGPKR
jgi:nucleotide-binding universal stress UspA family protein